MPGGYMGKLLFVNLSTGEMREEPLDENICRNFIGGNGIGARMLYSLQKGGVDSLGPDNTLGILTGPFTAHHFFEVSGRINPGFNPHCSASLLVNAVMIFSFSGSISPSEIELSFSLDFSKTSMMMRPDDGHHQHLPVPQPPRRNFSAGQGLRASFSQRRSFKKPGKIRGIC